MRVNSPRVTFPALLCLALAGPSAAESPSPTANAPEWAEIGTTKDDKLNFIELSWLGDWTGKQEKFVPRVPWGMLPVAEKLPAASLKALWELPSKEDEVLVTGPLVQEMLKAMGLSETQKIFIKTINTGTLHELTVASIKELVINRYDSHGEGNDNRSIYIVIKLPKEMEEKMTSIGSRPHALSFIGEENPFTDEPMKPVPWRDASQESTISKNGLAYLERKFDLGKRDLNPLAQSYSAGKTELFLVAFEFPEAKDLGFYLFLLRPENSDPIILDAVQGAGDNRSEPTVLIGKILKGYDEAIYEGGEGSLGCGTLSLIRQEQPLKVLKLQLNCKPSGC